MLARKRLIAGVPGVRTPMLVPSFSSKSQTQWKATDEIEHCLEFIVSPVLVSAYDLNYGLAVLPAGLPLVFVDSGGYEALRDVEAAERGLATDLQRQPWNEDLYEGALARLKSSSPIIAVSFDHPNNPLPVEAQIERALKHAATRPDIHRELLLKPEPNAEFHDIEAIRPHVAKLAPFAVIGVTDKELAPNLLGRMATIAALRKLLDGAGLETPIHVFGSLDPATSPLYFLAGADIFDGLTWLRYAFSEGRTLYMQNHGALELELSLRTESIQVMTWSKNYNYLVNLEGQMRRFLTGNKYEAFTHNREIFQSAHGTLIEMLEGG